MSDHLELANGGQEIAANIIMTSTKEELAIYLHQCLWSPHKSALLNAIHKNHLDSITGITYDLIYKHIPSSTATEKCHMIITRQRARSKRINHQEIKDARAQVNNMIPPEQVCTAIDDEMFWFAILEDQNENTIYSDLAGRFPVCSYSCMNYIFVAYVYKINSILVRPMATQCDATMIYTFKNIYEYLKARNLAPKLHILDNKCSKAVQKYVKSEKLEIQLVEPHNHRVNAAEPEVKTINITSSRH